jgi:hypothetical protein
MRGFYIEDVGILKIMYASILFYHTKKRLCRVIRVAIVKYDWKVSLPLRQDVPTCEAELENFSYPIKKPSPVMD